MENRDGCVSDRVVKKLAVEMPGGDLVDAYLTEIARGYGIHWAPSRKAETVDEDGSIGDSATTEKAALALEKEDLPAGIEVTSSSQGRSGGEGRQTPRLPELPPTEGEENKAEDKPREKERDNETQLPPPPPEDEFTTLAKRFEALKKR